MVCLAADSSQLGRLVEPNLVANMLLELPTVVQGRAMPTEVVAVESVDFEIDFGMDLN